MLRHVSVLGPRHDLQQITVERQVEREAAGAARNCWVCTVRVQVIQIGASLNNETKLLESAAALGPACLVGCQVSGNNNRSPWRLNWEDSAAPQVSRLIDDRWLVTLEVRVPALCVFSRGSSRVADVAMTNPVNQIAA